MASSPDRLTPLQRDLLLEFDRIPIAAAAAK
jgi:hypothetical protein